VNTDLVNKCLYFMGVRTLKWDALVWCLGAFCISD
jgi:hypothetical protein